MMAQSFIQKTLSVGPLQCNCQILVCPDTLDTVLIDPGEDAPKIIQAIEKIESELSAKKAGSKLNIKALLHTHAHFDHIAATKKVKEHFQNAPQIFLHKEDEFIYHQLPLQGQMFGFQFSAPAAVDQFVQDEQEMKLGSLKLSVIHTPGHSPGGVCFRLHSDTARSIPETVFTGDTLFRESIGRSDLWGGNESQLVKSIRSRLFTLDDDTCAWPGHGPKTSIGHEKKNNPYS